MDILSTVSSYFKTGGPFMYIILSTGVIMLAIAMERIWVIGRAASLNGQKFTHDLEVLVGRGEMTSALDLARSVGTPAGQVARSVLASGSQTPEGAQQAADTAATIFLPRLTRRLPHLSMLANVATLLGLLGTIFGLTTAFSAVGAADASQRSAFLAAGISQALNTTSFGLIIAVPALLCHGVLVARVESIVDQVDEVSARLVRALTARRTAADEVAQRERGVA
ncbi:MAG: MotA/TolQ/ExbB proton channel family protein [Candidatus Eisenbacteria bacterium]|uniref:MotA/TolQ/ExbB proton channel family protein n=1 Tax=Eiseniibacteriota bacterium TaxID=2212470 RepID=A0A7Y2EA14_UNCEI|nr:MotA/TolQ/ExbB proton channel family protein [Candidatus Eisenbacteria bacterium]